LPINPINSIKGNIVTRIGTEGNGTNFRAIFELLEDSEYDRIFILSDMQAADDIMMSEAYKNFLKKNNPYIYTVDLTGYGSTVFSSSTRLVQLFGYGAEIYELAKKIEIDPQALIKDINNITI